MERWIGIDVGKTWLDVAMRPSGEAWRVANDEAGWQTLIDRIGSDGPVRIVLEASGGYEVGVVVALDTAGMTPAVANPIATRRFAQSLRRGKTDRLDAAMLAAYAERMRPDPRPVPDAIARQLKELVARRRAVAKLLVEEQNRRHRASELTRPHIDAVIALLTTQRRELELLVASVVASDPDWQARVDQLDTVPGIGPLTATILAVGLPELGRISAKEVAALVGVAPHPRESGQFRGARHIGAGRGGVRHALYEAVVTTIRCNPTMHAHYDQLRARGKATNVARIACVRRVLGVLTAMVRDGLTWSQTEIGQGRWLPAAP